MDGQRFDSILRALAVGVSRRRVLVRLAGAVAGSPLALLGAERAGAQGKPGEGGKDKDKDKDKPGGGPSCREAGHPCEGNQVCCPGLECRVTGPGNAERCAAPAGAAEGCEGDCPEVCEGDCPEPAVVEFEEVCEGPCPPAAEVKFTPVPAYRVEVDCAFDEAAYQTTCTCAGVAEGGGAAVRRVILPPADVCAEVVGGDFAVATAGSGGEANAEASGGRVVVQGGDDVDADASGGQANADASGGSGNVAIAGGGRGVGYASAGDQGTLTLTLAGKVTTGATATYWCETESGLVPAPGPALVRVPDEGRDVGTIVVQASACDVAEPPSGFDWFGQCARPGTDVRFALASWEGATAVEQGTGATNEGGRLRFGQLPPGTYRLTQVDGSWCHAKCDSVDEQGNVVLKAGQRANVWVFSCGDAAKPAK